MVKDTLKTKAISGIVWTSLQKYSEMTIQFFSGIILARLLTPHDYGCIGIILIFVVLAESIIDGGFGSALIQKKRPTQLDYSTIFFLEYRNFLYTIFMLIPCFSFYFAFLWYPRAKGNLKSSRINSVHLCIYYCTKKSASKKITF